MLGTEASPFTPLHQAKRAVWQVQGAAREGDWRGVRNAAVVGVVNVANTVLAKVRRPRFRCPCCETDAYAFVHLANGLWIDWRAMCPTCGSRARHRAQALIAARLDGGGRLLHFAPEPILGEVLRREIPGVGYETTDYLMPGVDHPGEDIQSLSFPAESFDLVVCNHVLEHVADDDRAVAELARILRPGGAALISVPGDWAKAETVAFDDLSHNGHYRHYGRDFTEVLERHFDGVEVEMLDDLGQPGGLSLGIPPGDRAFVCR